MVFRGEVWAVFANAPEKAGTEYAIYGYNFSTLGAEIVVKTSVNYQPCALFRTYLSVRASLGLFVRVNAKPYELLRLFGG